MPITFNRVLRGTCATFFASVRGSARRLASETSTTTCNRAAVNVASVFWANAADSPCGIVNSSSPKKLSATNNPTIQ